MTKQETTRKPPARKEQKRGKSKTAAALASLRARLELKVTDADIAAARQLSNLHHDKRTPPIISHAIEQIFWDLAKLYAVPLPAYWTRKWLSIWPTLIAANKLQGSLPATISYTWEPNEKESARLDAEEEEENYARHVFDLMHDERLADDERELIWQSVSNAIDRAHATPTDNFEVFRVAWPLALEVDRELNLGEVSSRGDLFNVEGDKLIKVGEVGFGGRVTMLEQPVTFQIQDGRLRRLDSEEGGA